MPEIVLCMEDATMKQEDTSLTGCSIEWWREKASLDSNKY